MIAATTQETSMLGKPSRRMRKKLETRGRSATATVVEIAERGMTVTNGSEGLVSATELILRTKLRVEPEGEPSFEVEQRFRYPQLSVPSVGSRVCVIFDPDDHDDIMIDRTKLPGLTLPGQGAAATGAPGTPAAAGMLDLGGLLSTVREAQAQGSGAVAEALRASFGANAVVVDASGAGAAPDSPDPAARLEKLAKLREDGLLTDEEFAAQKARLLDAGL
jgi:hypothetical protein